LIYVIPWRYLRERYQTEQNLYKHHERLPTTQWLTRSAGQYYNMTTINAFLLLCVWPDQSEDNIARYSSVHVVSNVNVTSIKTFCTFVEFCPHIYTLPGKVCVSTLSWRCSTWHNYL